MRSLVMVLAMSSVAFGEVKLSDEKKDEIRARMRQAKVVAIQTPREAIRTLKRQRAGSRVAQAIATLRKIESGEVIIPPALPRQIKVGQFGRLPADSTVQILTVNKSSVLAVIESSSSYIVPRPGGSVVDTVERRQYVVVKGIDKATLESLTPDQALKVECGFIATGHDGSNVVLEVLDLRPYFHLARLYQHRITITGDMRSALLSVLDRGCRFAGTRSTTG